MGSRAAGAGLIAGVLAGLIAGVGVALWSASSDGGPVSAEIVTGLIVGLPIALLAAAVVGRLDRRHLLGEPTRLAGGVGTESATANPDPGVEPEDQSPVPRG